MQEFGKKLSYISKTCTFDWNTNICISVFLSRHLCHQTCCFIRMWSILQIQIFIKALMYILFPPGMLNLKQPWWNTAMPISVGILAYYTHLAVISTPYVHTQIYIYYYLRNVLGDTNANIYTKLVACVFIYIYIYSPQDA